MSQDTQIPEAVPEIPTGNAGAKSIAIEKVAAGTVVVAETGQVERIAFRFPFSSAKFAVLDIDLVAMFDDGAKIILPGLAMRMLGDGAPKFYFEGQPVDPQLLMAKVGDIQLADQLPQLVVSQSLRATPETAAASTSSGIPVVQLPSIPPPSLTPSPRTRFQTEDDANGSAISVQTGRFARRTNSEDAPFSGSGGGQTESNDPAGQPEPKGINANPLITSDGGGITASRILTVLYCFMRSEAAPMQHSFQSTAKQASSSSLRSRTSKQHWVSAAIPMR
jgi:hypothetical protein